MLDTTKLDHALLWGLLLAAGDGKRLQEYVRQLKGEDLPKQYVNFVGQRSMLEHTFHRAEKLIPREQILTVVSRDHLASSEVRRQLSDRPSETIVVQPENKETGPGILLPLMFLYKRCPDAIVAVFPSDHFILEEERFMNYVRLAAQAVHYDPSRIVLLAVEAHEPETEYGYIVPCEKLRQLCRFGTQKVSGFFEKPDEDLAFKLVLAGALWNTMTMVFELKTLLDLVRRVYPGIYFNFCRILEAIGTIEEQPTINEVYELLESINFSKGLLEKIAHHHPETISVLPVREVYWSDWGSPVRISRTLGIQKHEPTAEWMPPQPELEGVCQNQRK
jgi:mannose-1-phosphate guanylyltransferase